MKIFNINGCAIEFLNWCVNAKIYIPFDNSYLKTINCLAFFKLERMRGVKC